jgi:hypothetical protein
VLREEKTASGGQYAVAERQLVPVAPVSRMAALNFRDAHITIGYHLERNYLTGLETIWLAMA